MSNHFCRELVAKKNDFIKFPFTDAKKDENKEQFYKMGGFPSCILAVDGFHVRICTPYVDEDDFVNRIIFHSITVIFFIRNYLNFEPSKFLKKFLDFHSTILGFYTRPKNTM